jgi:peptide/nickel transport system ATP-binding protein/oligopeptide transport system ATP-binding protein
MLRVEDLHKRFRSGGGLLRRPVVEVAAVAGVSFAIEPRRTLGLVGESGCGKSTLARTIVRLHEPTSGEIWLDGERITHLPASALRPRRRAMQMIFQDPHASLDPRDTVAGILREPLDVHGIGAPAARDERVSELLGVVGLADDLRARHPHELSGGQRQRVGIARALALEPKVIVADEPVSSLDVTVRAQVLELLARLQRERGIACLFISHDLAVVRHVSDEVAVMYLGRIVEHAPVAALYAAPKHPYTRALLSATPSLDAAGRRERIALRGEAASAAAMPAGCPFHPRCPQAMDICARVAPQQRDAGTPGAPHLVSCHLT